MSARALSKGYETKWTVLSGGMQGNIRIMTVSQFTLGRSPECEFVITNDPKCSRKHARIEWTHDQCMITSLNEANPVSINGQESQAGELHDGDRILIGETEMLFNLTGVPTETSPSLGAKPASLQIVPPSMMQQPMYGGGAPQAYGGALPGPQAPRTRKAKKQEMPMARKILFGVVGLAVLLFLLPNGAKKKKEEYLLTNQQIQADIDTANKLNEAAQASQTKRFETSITARQAQENFVRGFRDYRKGQFERSLDSFQACLSLDPSHPLCNRYIRLAQRRFNEIVQFNVVLGRKYRDQNQFNECRSAFRNVMVMVKDSNSITYREAKANYDACSALSEGRY